MPITASLIGLGGSLFSGIFGKSQADKDREAANAARQAALQQFLNIHVPDPEQQKIQLEHLKQTGKLTPDMEQTFQQQQSELGGIVLDPTSRAAQMQALAKMQEVADAGGMDAQSKLKLQSAIDATNTNEKAQRDAIVQNYAARGMGGSGAQLQAELMAGQSDANRASQQGLQSAADAEMRALQAMQNSSAMAGNVRSQDYNQAADRAKAQDAINQFNARNSQQVAGANIDRSNKAQQYNLDTAQRVADQNVGLDNQQEVFNKNLLQQQFNNQMSKAAGASGQYGQVATQHTANADRTADMWSGVGQAISQGAGAIGQYANGQKQQDKQVERDDYNALDQMSSDGSLK